MKTRLKICGISTLEIARLVVEMGVDALGFIFHPESPRYVVPEQVRSILRELPVFVNKVGVFVKHTPLEVMKIVEQTGLDTIQLHGDQDQDFIDELRDLTRLPILLARRLDRLDSRELKKLTLKGVNTYLLDKFDPSEFGGTGQVMDLRNDFSQDELDFIRNRVVLAGGITAKNTGSILSTLKPYGIDLSSSLEKEKGVKDPDLIREFVKTFNGVK